PVFGDRPVDLTYGRSSKRLRIPFCKHTLWNVAKLFHDHGGSELRAHRRRVLLEPAHRRTEIIGYVLVDVARHLAHFHQHAFHRAQLLCHLVRSAKSEVMPELLALLHRREEEPRRPRRIATAYAEKQSCQ